jgi:hypothetical protein
MSTNAMSQVVSIAGLQDLLRSPPTAEAVSVVSSSSAPCLIVDLDSGRIGDGVELVQPACTVIGVSRHAAPSVPAVVDVVATGTAALAELERAVREHPQAACVLMQVLRHNASASVADGLLVESLAYSALQHGAEFARWLDGRELRVREPAAPPEYDLVLMERKGASLAITLNRPRKRNAYSAALRDALCAALELPLEDPTIEDIIVRGAGPAFCAGGDLDEFGSARDAAAAHLIRATRNAGALIHRLRERITCRLHGACIGAGIELPAFAGHVVAAEDAHFRLPEVAMGLIPGAGGTVSIVKRIGRLRTAWLALSNAAIDAPTALAWGLVDAVEE